MPSYPSSHEWHLRLKAAGWSVGYVRVLSLGGPRWLVTGTNGENAVAGRGRTLDEAYWRACQPTEAAGMLAVQRYGGRLEDRRHPPPPRAASGRALRRPQPF